MLHQPVSVPTLTEVATGYAPRRRNLTYVARPDSAIIPEQSPRFEKGGDATIHGKSTERIQAVQDSIFEGGESGDSFKRLLIYCQSRDTDDNEGSQALNQSSAPEGNEQ